jgi:hypothetical protein
MKLFLFIALDFIAAGLVCWGLWDYSRVWAASSASIFLFGGLISSMFARRWRD